MKMNARLLAAGFFSFVAVSGCDCTGGVNGTLKPPTFTTTNRVTNKKDFTIAGTKQENTSVSLQRADDKPFEAVPLDDSESFSASVTLEEGENPFFGVAVDSAGRTSDPAGPITITLDTVPPDAPVFDPIETDVAVDNGAQSAAVIVTGSTGPDCELKVVVGTTPLSRTALTQTGEAFSFTANVPLGEVDVSATCVDPAANRSQPSTLTFTGAYDVTPPAPPTVEPVDNPIVIDADATSVRVTLQGTRERRAAITFDDVEAFVGDAGAVDTEWSVVRDYPLGVTTIAVRAVDRARNVSEPTTAVVDVRHLPRAPVAIPPTLTNQPTLPVDGFCDDGVAVGVAFAADEPAGLFDTLAACAAGEFVVDVALTQGANEYYLYAVDNVGLESPRVGPFTTVLDTVAPAAPVLSFPSCTTTSPAICNVFIATGQTTGPFNVAGTREVDSAIVVDGVRVAEPGSADWTGVVSVALAQTRVLEFRAVDEAGNASVPTTVTVNGIAGLALPTVACLGPYKIAGTNAACPLELVESRRAIRGDRVTLRGTKVAGSGVRVHNLATDVVTTLNADATSAWALTVSGAVIGRQEFAVSVFNQVSESSEIGPFPLRRDETAPAAPALAGLAEFHTNGDPDVAMPLDGTAGTRADRGRVTGSKDLDGDICVAQVIVNETTCPGGVCPDGVFSECLPIAAADGLTEWGCASTTPTCEPNLGLQPGLNRLCFESSDIVPADGEAPNRNPLGRIFAGNRSARACVDVDRAVDPLPSFVRPVEGTLVRPGPLRVEVAIDQPVELTDAVRVCVGAGDAACVDAAEVQTDLWEATVTVPVGAAGSPVVLRADALVATVVRGTATITATLLPGSLLVTDFAISGGVHRTVGAFAPQVAVGPAQETVFAWEDDCWNDLDVGCPVRDTRNVLSTTIPTDVFLRTFAGGQLSRTVNVSDEAAAVHSTQPSITISPTGEIHVAWIDDGFGHPNKTMIHRVIGFDGRACVNDAGCGASALCIDQQCHPVRSSTIVVDDQQPSGEPSLAPSSTGELVAVWWKVTDPSPDFKDSAYLKLGVYCSTDCNYDNGNIQPAGTWETADITPQQRGLILSNPVVVVDDSRNAWVAWHQQRCTGSNPLDRCATVGDFAIRFTRVPLDRNTSRIADPPITISTENLDSASAPELAWDGAGYVHIAWSTPTGIRYRRFDTLAQPEVALSAEQQVYSGPVGGVSLTAIDADTVVAAFAPALGECPVENTVDPTAVDPQALRSVVIADGFAREPTVVTPALGVSSATVAAIAGGAVVVVYEDESETSCGEYRPDIRFDVITP